MDGHRHTAKHVTVVTNGRYDVCDCGAVRHVPRGDDERKVPWHACHLCCSQVPAPKAR